MRPSLNRVVTALRPSLDLDFVGGVLDGRVSFARTTAGSVVGANGLVQSIASAKPRFEYDPTSLAPLGMLVEEFRTNSCLRSEDFSHATWNTTTNTTVTVNTFAGADGATTANTLTATGANGVRQQGVTTTAASWTFSVWLARKTGSGNVQITMDGTTWVTQTLTSTLTRFTVTQTGVAGTSNPGIRLVTSGDEVYAWGAQAEAGAFATTYCVTTSASFARNSDSPLVSGGNFASWFLDSGEGTVFVDLRFPAAASVYPSVVCIGKGVPANDEVTIYLEQTSLKPTLEVRSGGVSQCVVQCASSISEFSSGRLAAAWAPNNFGLAVNGQLGPTDTAGSSPTGYLSMSFGTFEARGSGAPAVGNSLFRRIRYWPRRLPNAMLQALTA